MVLSTLTKLFDGLMFQETNVVVKFDPVGSETNRQHIMCNCKKCFIILRSAIVCIVPYDPCATVRILDRQLKK